MATAGLTCYTAGTIKHLPGLRTYVSVDGGMSDNPRPVLYGSGYEAFLPREVTAPRPRVVTVVGKHCESGDVLVRDACVPEDLSVGDVLATPVTGAYGHSDGVELQQGAPPAGCLRERRPPSRGRPAGDLLRPPGAGGVSRLAPALPGQGTAPVASLLIHRNEPNGRHWHVAIRLRL